VVVEAGFAAAVAMAAAAAVVVVDPAVEVGMEYTDMVVR
jgi:hypothetical protein